ncbi:MAG: hypothetical protein E2581_21585 [Pseudomonas sp.]|uniref:co-regulatory protein PtrA N-terminal domain-containing protein n=1 Tax=unclassified Pseudomonas TaxID=196821 RepID=UPI001D327ED5|nr:MULTISPECIES: co-regulatory protein PtrA N-terminal domain-containing protein [unclassified Pseudomonas]MPT01067.1 hypothetical protein [Pseudomonas sp.]WEZ88151.1 co-regulatory protein PtrA N-terminal domain-containing protein [Pseudomonas sp. NyZ480]
MNSVKAVVMAATFGMANLAHAEGGGDRTFMRMEAARQSSQQAYQLTQENNGQTPVAAQQDQHTGHKHC